MKRLAGLIIFILILQACSSRAPKATHIILLSPPELHRFIIHCGDDVRLGSEMEDCHELAEDLCGEEPYKELESYTTGHGIETHHVMTVECRRS